MANEHVCKECKNTNGEHKPGCRFDHPAAPPATELCECGHAKTYHQASPSDGVERMHINNCRKCPCPGYRPASSPSVEPAESEADFKIEPINTYTLHVPLRFVGQGKMPDFNEDEPAEAKACEHRNTKFSDIGMRDCLDCGGKEIDYQPDDPPTQSTADEGMKAGEYINGKGWNLYAVGDIEGLLNGFAASQLSAAKAKWAEEFIGKVEAKPECRGCDCMAKMRSVAADMMKAGGE